MAAHVAILALVDRRQHHAVEFGADPLHPGEDLAHVLPADLAGTGDRLVEGVDHHHAHRLAVIGGKCLALGNDRVGVLVVDEEIHPLGEHLERDRRIRGDAAILQPCVEALGDALLALAGLVQHQPRLDVHAPELLAGGDAHSHLEHEEGFPAPAGARHHRHALPIEEAIDQELVPQGWIVQLVHADRAHARDRRCRTPVLYGLYDLSELLKCPTRFFPVGDILRAAP